jgi:mRNA interferase MazF
VKRGELYRVYKASKNYPKRYRVFVVVSRQTLIDSKFSTVICAPIYSSYNEISTQVPVGVDDGLKHNSCIYCDELISIPKSVLTNYTGSLSEDKMKILDHALKVSLDIE